MRNNYLSFSNIWHVLPGLMFTFFFSFTSLGSTFTVTNTDDSGAGSLRQAILDANANPGPDVIDATGVSGTIIINPANYFLVITDDVTINGPGQANLTISGDNASRIFWIQNGTITIQDLTLANGYAKGGNGGGGGMGAGGAIFMHEGRQDPNTTNGILSGRINLTLINVTLKDNVALGGNGGFGNGGGGGMGGNGAGPANPDGYGLYGGGGGVLGNAVSWEYGGSVTDATLSARGTNGGIAIFGSGGKYGNYAVGFGGGGGYAVGFGGGGQNAQDGGGSGSRGGFGGGGGGAGSDNNYLNNGGKRGGFGGGGGGLQYRGNGSQGDNGGDDGQGGFGGGQGTDTGGGGMGAGGAIFMASGTLTLKSVTFQNNSATGGTGGNSGQGLGGALFIFNKTDNGGNTAPGTTNDPQVSGCGITFLNNSASTNNDDVYGTIASNGDSDSDGVCDVNDGCPNDPNKTSEGACGCNVADTDTDGDGTADCDDGCPDDPNKTSEGACGCNVADTDTDGDGTEDCDDGCPEDAGKTSPSVCGCGVADTDSDSDGTLDCNDSCPNDPNKIASGTCGCGVADTDSDGDGTPDCIDGCPNDPNKTVAGTCCDNPNNGGGVDSDCDGVGDLCDVCPRGNDKVDYNQDLTPDCSQLLSYNAYSPDWRRIVKNKGKNINQIVVCHNYLTKNGIKHDTKWINAESLADHFGHGDQIGPCTSCGGQPLIIPGGNGTIEVQEMPALELIPNPAYDQVKVHLQGLVSDESVLTLFDRLGRVVLTQQIGEGENQLILDLTSEKFSSGEYFVRVASRQVVLTKMLVIAR
jgi:hypothetical protein